MSCALCKKPFTLEEPGCILHLSGDRTVGFCAGHWKLLRFMCRSAGHIAKKWVAFKYPKLAGMFEEIQTQLREKHGA